MIFHFYTSLLFIVSPFPPNTTRACCMCATDRDIKEVEGEIERLERQRAFSHAQAMGGPMIITNV